MKKLTSGGKDVLIIPNKVALWKPTPAPSVQLSKWLAEDKALAAKGLVAGRDEQLPPNWKVAENLERIAALQTFLFIDFNQKVQVINALIRSLMSDIPRGGKIPNRIDWVDDSLKVHSSHKASSLLLKKAIANSKNNTLHDPMLAEELALLPDKNVEFLGNLVRMQHYAHTIKFDDLKAEYLKRTLTNAEFVAALENTTRMCFEGMELNDIAKKLLEGEARFPASIAFVLNMLKDVEISQVDILRGAGISRISDAKPNSIGPSNEGDIGEIEVISVNDISSVDIKREPESMAQANFQFLSLILENAMFNPNYEPLKDMILRLYLNRKEAWPEGLVSRLPTLARKIDEHNIRGNEFSRLLYLEVLMELVPIMMAGDGWEEKRIVLY
jgi:hypothetical protein